VKKIRFYNTIHDKNILNYDYVWVPNSEDFQYYLEYFINYSKRNVEIESILAKHIKADLGKLRTFKTSTQNLVGYKKLTIVLYAQSDTLANSCSKLSSTLSKEIRCELCYPRYNDEGAKDFFKSKKIEALKFSKSELKRIKPDLFFLLNDWSKEAKRVISICRLLKIPTICIQESIIDFGDNIKRMQFSDYVFVQGIQTVLDLKRTNYYLTGNPRYSVSAKVLSDNKTEQKALINCNFTYNIYEDIRNSWIKDIIRALQTNSIKFKISQHPRDKADLSKLTDYIIHSDSGSISKQISNSDIIISRFSSLIHESILQNKKVIYYNPHNEKMKYNFRFNSEFLHLCKTPKELEEALVFLLKKRDYDNKPYVIQHCMPLYTKVIDNFEFILKHENFVPLKFKIKDLVILFVYCPSILKMMRSIYYPLKRVLRK